MAELDAGAEVATNLRRLRGGRTLKELSERVAQAGGTLAELALGRIENNKRRVDARELVLLAVALDVSPLELLLPRPSEETYSLGEAVSGASGSDLWRWSTESGPLRAGASEVNPTSDLIDQLRRRRRRLRVEVRKQENRLARAQADLRQHALDQLTSGIDSWLELRSPRQIEEDIEDIDDRLAAAQIDLEDVESQLALLE